MKKIKFSAVFALLLIAVLGCTLAACGGDDGGVEYNFTTTVCDGVMQAEFDSVVNKPAGATALSGTANLRIYLKEYYSGEDMVVKFNGVPVTMTRAAEDTTGRTYNYSYTPTADFTLEITGVKPQTHTLAMPSNVQLQTIGIESAAIIGIDRLNNLESPSTAGQKDFTEITQSLPQISDLDTYKFKYGDRVLIQLTALSGKVFGDMINGCGLVDEGNNVLETSSVQPETENKLNCVVKMDRDRTLSISQSGYDVVQGKTYSLSGDLDYFDFAVQKSDDANYAADPKNLATLSYCKIRSANSLVNTTSAVAKLNGNALSADTNGWYTLSLTADSVLTVEGIVAASGFNADNFRFISVPNNLSDISFKVYEQFGTSFTQMGYHDGCGVFVVRDGNNTLFYFEKSTLTTAANTFYTVQMYSSKPLTATVSINGNALSKYDDDEVSLAYETELVPFASLHFILDATDGYRFKLCSDSGDVNGAYSTYGVVDRYDALAIDVSNTADKKAIANFYLTEQAAFEQPEMSAMSALVAPYCTAEQDGTDVVLTKGSTIVRVHDAVLSDGLVMVSASSALNYELTFDSALHSSLNSGATYAAQGQYTSVLAQLNPGDGDASTLYVMSLMQTSKTDKYNVWANGSTAVDYEVPQSFIQQNGFNVDVIIGLFANYTEQ